MLKPPVLLAWLVCLPLLSFLATVETLHALRTQHPAHSPSIPPTITTKHLTSESSCPVPHEPAANTAKFP
eukprot:g77454.t1